jgi:hypothetical protein
MSLKSIPTADIFLEHLGKPIEAIPDDVFAHANKRDFSLPDHSPIGGIFFTSIGFSVAFCAPDFYQVDDKLALSPAIITNVQFYNGDPYYQQARYESALPFGIAFTDSRADLLKKLGAPKWRFPFVDPIKLERWDFEDRWLVVRYTDDMSAVRQVQVGLKPQKPAETVLPKILQPDIHTVQSQFGHKWDAVATHAEFTGMDFSELADVDDGDACEVDELKTHGIELYFRPSKKKDESFHIFSGCRYIRKGLMFSAGFDGELPKGLRFDDTPDVAVKKVGAFPVTGNADELTGYYVWKLPEYLLHVGYSVLEQRVNRIYVASHPYYAPELLESPLLKSPI